MRSLGMTNLGAVTNHEYALPVDATPEAIDAAKLYDGLYNRWFLSGLYSGTYPPDVLAHLEPHMPKGWQDDMNTIAAPVDWAGINYYTRKLIGPGPSGAFGDFTESVGDRPRTSMGWEIYPDGLYEIIRCVAGAYTRNLPIYIPEKGIAAPGTVAGGAGPGPPRHAYLRDHMAIVQRAIAEGIDIRGYFIWSLLDNYEWALGYEKRFGLVHVDFDTLTRTPKASWQALKAGWGQ